MKKKCYAILILIWMLTVFTLSNQPAVKSSKTSGNTIKAIINIFAPNLSDIEQKELIEDLQPIVRKLAHFSLYTLGGILIYFFINTLDVTKKIKIIFSLMLGALYASTDELHQVFIEGRSGEFRDICIDSSGVLFGIFIAIILIKIITKIKNIKRKT